MPATNAANQLAAVYTLANNVSLQIPYPTTDPSLMDSVVLFNYSPYVCEVKTGLADGFIAPWTVDRFKTGGQNQVTVTPEGTIAGGTKPIPVISNQMLALFVTTDEALQHSGMYTYPQNLIAPDQIAQAIVAQQQAAALLQSVPTISGPSHGAQLPIQLFHDQTMTADINNLPTVMIYMIDSFYNNGDGATTHAWQFIFYADAGLTIQTGVYQYELNAGNAPNGGPTSLLTLPSRGRYLQIVPVTGGPTTESFLSITTSSFSLLIDACETKSVNSFVTTTALPSERILARIPLGLLVPANTKSVIFRLPITTGRITVSGTLNATETGYLIYGFGADINTYSLVPMRPSCYFDIAAPRAPMWIQFYAGDGTIIHASGIVNGGDR